MIEFEDANCNTNSCLQNKQKKKKKYAQISVLNHAIYVYIAG